jgi:hypothetical protein
LGGSALSALAVIAAVRAPRAPWSGPFRAADALVLALTALLAALMLSPVIGASLEVALGAVMAGEDLARHYGMYDTIRRLGGYVFVQADALLVLDAIQDVHRTYPQGFHAATAILDNFLTSSTSSAAVVDGLGRFLLYNLGCYVFSGFAILWAIRRVAGPAASAMALLAPGALAVGYVFFGEAMLVYLSGSAPEIYANAFFAILIALLARPLRRVGEQVLTVFALLLAIAYSYAPLLPVALLSVAAWAWTHRRTLRRRPRTVGVLAAGAVGCASLPLLYGRPPGALDMFLSQFAIEKVSFGPLVVLAGLVAVALLSEGRPLRSVPHRWLTVVSVLMSAAVALVVGALQVSLLGRTAYYFDKTLHTVAVALLVCTGLCERLIHGWLRRSQRSAVLASVLAIACLGAFGAIGPLSNNWESPGRRYLARSHFNTASAAEALRVVRSLPDPGRRTTLLASAIPHTAYYGTLWVAVLQGDYARTVDGYTYMGLRAPKTPEALVGIVTEHPTERFQIVTANPAKLAALRALVVSRPELDLEVVDAAGLRAAAGVRSPD